MYRHIAANALFLIIAALVVLGFVVQWAQTEYRAPGPLTETTLIPVERGDNLTRVTNRLTEAGAISNPSIFRVAARYSGKDAELKFADYEIPAGASMEEVLTIVTSGKGFSFNVTIVEGWSSWQVVEKLKSVEDLTGELENIPPEGTLAPNTYSYARGATRASLIEQMTAAQAKILEDAWLVRDPETPLKTKEEALILASIIEKETGLAEERPQVASVFVNRLNRGMQLQTDPTVIYGITNGVGTLGRGLRRSELNAETPYNTYVIPGLPPGPIANPGKAAIEAALNPAETEFIFFVADGTGGHAFSRTLSEHNDNVAKWRQIEAKRAAEAAEAAEAAAAEEAEGASSN